MTKKRKSTATGSKRGAKSAPASSGSSSNSSVSSVASTKEPTKGKEKSRKQNEANADSKKRQSASNKKQQSSKAEPPFPLVKDASTAGISEGIESVVNLLRGRKNIVVLVGAGISVSCGIPDFRSKGSGLYSTLNHEVGKGQRTKARVVDS